MLNANWEISRRSAYDRCRRQNLRRLRRAPPGGKHSQGEILTPCNSCLKAGADCINIVNLRKTQSGTRIQDISFSSYGDKTLQALFPRTSAACSIGSASSEVQVRASGHSNARFAEQPTKPDETTNTDPQRIHTPPSKERLRSEEATRPHTSHLTFQSIWIPETLRTTS